MSKPKFKDGDIVLFITSFPSGSTELVRLIKKKHETNKWYIRFLDGGTDATSEDFLYRLPIGVEAIVEPKKEDFHE